MSSMTLFFLLLCSPTLSFALDHQLPQHESWPRWLWRRASSSRNVPPEGYHNPLQNGGSMLTQIPMTFPIGQGEPINTIVSGNSDTRVLVDSEADGGLRNFFLSFGFSGECLGQHSGSDQAANLGDGNGYKNETSVIRWNYGDPQLGSCKETVEGGNHFRYWVQDGPQGNSGAIFMAVSYELPIALQHDIIPNGYNLGRDWLIGNITRSSVPTLNVTDSTTYSSSTSFGGYTYQTDIKYVSGLLPDTNDGINHNITVGVGGINSTDGLVAVLDVKITEGPPSASAAWRPVPSQSWYLPPLILLFSSTVLPLLALS
ncbi:hypothetical protein BDQ12DRAFT_336518 [Crucibulum laeve]|uniref:Uncharacterized protein n=1 Tax=Crucibulum laeve TaxID=68775 RepID=A0A5C3LPQ6_9AGAR|nr:hypothetical protein BDQ12DRAFT_336518 [Crucibulum laeve]